MTRSEEQLKDNPAATSAQGYSALPCCCKKKNGENPSQVKLMSFLLQKVTLQLRPKPAVNPLI